MIDIPQEQVHRLDALLHAAIDPAPVRGRDHARNDVEGQDAVDSRAVAIDREGDAEREQLALRVLRAHAELRQLKLLEMMPKRRQMAVAVFGLEPISSQ